MRTYDKKRHKQIMVPIDVYKSLKSLKESIQGSFGDAIKRLMAPRSLMQDHRAEAMKVEEKVEPFWESELFG